MPDSSPAPPGLPPSLARIWPLLSTFVLPADGFDPAGEHELRYAVRPYFPNGPAQPEVAGGLGALRIRRRPLREGAELRVSLAPGIGGNSERLEAEIICRSDRLCTPLRWKMRTLLVSPQGSPVAGSEVQESWELHSGKLTRSGVRQHVLPVSEPVTGNWCLFAALPLWAPEDRAETRFTLLEEMQLLRSEARVVPRGVCELGLPAGPLRLWGYDLFARGVLPTTLWLDAVRRPLFVIQGLRVILWNPTVKVTEVSL
jgi:hypothetical protein